MFAVSQFWFIMDGAQKETSHFSLFGTKQSFFFFNLRVKGIENFSIPNKIPFNIQFYLLSMFLSLYFIC